MALVEGVKYGLSASDNNNLSTSATFTGSSRNKIKSNGTSKSVMFVRLTDSALKAIEDYLRSQHKTGQNSATLQFLGNEGRINIPSSGGSNSRFDFSLSSNADIEGPQGSFECIQQCGSSSLKSMGTVPFKMRIQAKDDVYETTRQRMNALEETRKHDCSAKEIKPNGADIGRKVKKKLSRSSIPSLSSNQFSNNNRQISSPPNNSYNQPKSVNNNKPINGHHSSSSSSLQPNSINRPYTNNHQVSGMQLSPSNHSHNHGTSNNFLRQNQGSGGGLVSNPSTTQKPITGGDITKRPLRDRLIHLLALKPYKKPELIARLHKDGLKEKDKKSVMPVLTQVSALRNNEYILNRGIWNDIQEDWPFYTEQEKQIMKRRKPQNLTPPGSDCSVGSASSYSSVSPRSSVSNGPPSPPGGFSSKANVDPFMPGAKRTSPADFDREGSDNKRQRISHFKRPGSSSGNSANPPNSSGNYRDRDYSNHSPSTAPPSATRNAGNYWDRLSPSGQTSQVGNVPAGRHGPPDIGLSPHSYEYPSYPWHGTKNMDPSTCDRAKLPDSDETDSLDSGNGGSNCSTASYSNGSLASNYSGVGKQTPERLCSPSNTNDYNHHPVPAVATSGKEDLESYEQGDKFASSERCDANNRNSANWNHRDKDRSLKRDGNVDVRGRQVEKEVEPPSYISEFPPIHSKEQRSRYRTEFMSHYEEYMRIHTVIDKVSKRFAHLDERLRRSEPGSQEYTRVKDQIFQEYNENKSNPEFVDCKKKFDYLHARLSHIKRLVLEYDGEHSIPNSDYDSETETDPMCRIEEKTYR